MANSATQRRGFYCITVTTRTSQRVQASTRLWFFTWECESDNQVIAVGIEGRATTKAGKEKSDAAMP